MIIRSKRVFIGGKMKPAALAIISGRISAIHSYTYEKRHGLDLGDLILLPGAVDAHVHFRDPEAPYKEDFATGSTAAVAGGTTSVMDMPNYANPPTTTVGAYLQKERIASSTSRCDFALHFGGTNDNADLVKRFSPQSMKVFLADTHSPLTVNYVGLERHFLAFPKEKPIIVHCEDQQIIERNMKKEKAHEKVRSQKAALEAVSAVAALSKKHGGRRVHFPHLSTADEVKAARTAKGASCEVAPHHLFLCDKDIERLKGWGNVNPPLRPKAEVAKLWKMLAKVDCVASDHAPHTGRDKEGGASGFPGVQTMYPLMLHAALEKRISLGEAIRLCCSGPAKAFGITGKGALAVGFDADIVAFDPTGRWGISHRDLYSKAGWSPYEGMELKGRIAGVFIRGNEAVIGNGIQAAAGFGKKLLFQKKA